MPSNVTADLGAGGSTFLSKQVSHDGNTVQMSGVHVLGMSGTEDAYTANLIDGSVANGLEVDVTRVQGTVTVDGSAVTQPVSIAADVMLGTDFSNVLGTASLILATQADALVNTSDGLQTTSLGYVFNGTAWDRLRGDITNGVLVNLGTNNDVTVTGTVTVDGSGVTQPISAASLPLPTGASTAANQTTGNTALAAIQAAVEGTLTVGSHAVTNAGTFAVQVDGAALTALQLLDDIVATLGTTTYTETTTKGNVIGAVRNDVLATLASLDNEIAPLQVNASGALYVDGSDVTQPISAASLPLPTGAATETTLAAVQAAVEIMDDWDETNRAAVNTISGQVGVQGGAGTDTALTQRVSLASDVSLPTGTNPIGNVGLAPRTAGGFLIELLVSAASTNDTLVKSSAGQLYGWYVSNIASVPAYLKIYNKASAPVVGTDVPVMDLLIPGNTAGVAGHVEFTNGIAFATGIGFGITAAVGPTDNTAVSANEVVIHLFYK